MFVEDAILFLVVFLCHMLSLDFFGLCFELVEATHESIYSEQAVWTGMVRLPEKPLPVLVCYGPICILTMPNLLVHECAFILFLFCGCRRNRFIFAHGMITQI